MTHADENLNLIYTLVEIVFSLEIPPKIVKGVKEKLLKGDEHPQDLKNMLQKLSEGWEAQEQTHESKIPLGKIKLKRYQPVPLSSRSADTDFFSLKIRN